MYIMLRQILTDEIATENIYDREHRKGNHKLTNLYFKLNGIDAIPNKQNSIILIACIIICQNLHVLSSVRICRSIMYMQF
jgi:hypothetical protein